MRFLFHTVGRHVPLVHLCERGAVILHEALSANFNIVFAASGSTHRPADSLGVVITGAGVRALYLESPIYASSHCSLLLNAGQRENLFESTI